MEVAIIKKIFTFFICLFIFLSLSKNNSYATSFDILSKNEIENITNSVDINGFLEDIKSYANEYFPELADENYINDIISGKISNENFIEKIVNVFVGEFRNNIALILKILGIAILCSILKNIQSSFSDTGISEIAFYVFYLLIIVLIISSFTSVIASVVETVSKLSNFMNMLVPLIIALITVTGNITTISFLQPLILGMIALIAYVLNHFVIPVIYIATIINIVTNISEHIKLDKLSELLKKCSLWIIEFAMIIFTCTLSIEGTLASSVDGMTSKIAKNIVTTTIPVVGKILGDTVDSVIGGVAITKNAIGIIGIIVILAITLIPLIKSLITMAVFSISSALIEPIADSRISKCISGISGSLKIVVGILAIITFMFIIAVTIMIKVSNNALMYK